MFKRQVCAKDLVDRWTHACSAKGVSSFNPEPELNVGIYLSCRMPEKNHTTDAITHDPLLALYTPL